MFDIRAGPQAGNGMQDRPVRSSIGGTSEGRASAQQDRLAFDVDGF
jgi:hypothetical protein